MIAIMIEVKYKTISGNYVKHVTNRTGVTLDDFKSLSSEIIAYTDYLKINGIIDDLEQIMLCSDIDNVREKYKLDKKSKNKFKKVYNYNPKCKKLKFKVYIK